MFGPVFWLELVTSVRRLRYYVLRGLYAALLFMLLFSAYSGTAVYSSTQLSIQQVALLASQFFQSFAWMQLVAVLLLAPGMSASTIALERQRRTIEYLFATDLRNHELILGKLGAKLLVVASLLAVGLAILSIFRLLGGIPATQMFAVFLIAISTMVSVSAVGLLVSVWSPRPRDAIVRTYLVLVVLFMLPLVYWAFSMGGLIPARVGFADQLIQQMLAFNPLWVQTQVLWGAAPGMFGGGPWWQSLATMIAGQSALAVGLVLIAALTVRRVHRRAMGRAARVPAISLCWLRWRRPLGDRPMLWKELFAHQASVKLGIAGRLALVLLIAVVLVTTVGYFVYCLRQPFGQSPFDAYSDFSTGMGSLVGSCSLLILAVLAAESVTREKESGNWTLLLSTPLSGWEIITAKIVGNLYAIRYPIGLVGWVWGMAVLLDPSYVWMLPLTMGTLAVLTAFISTLGVCLSLCLSTTIRATAATVAVTIFLFGGYMMCCLPIGVLPQWLEPVYLSLCIPYLLGFSNNLVSPAYLEWEWLAAYLAGMTFYSLATAGLISLSVVYFDRLVGRTRL